MGNPSSPSIVLPREEDNPLVSGYIRSSVDFEVPLALVQLCLNYYNEVVMRKVSVRKLDEYFRKHMCDMAKWSDEYVPGRSASFPLMNLQYNMGLWFFCHLNRKEEGNLSVTTFSIMHICSKNSGVRCLACQTRLRINETGTEFFAIFHQGTTDPCINGSAELEELQDLTQLKWDSLCFSFEIIVDWVSFDNGKIERFTDDPVQLRKSWSFETETKGQDILSNLTKGRFIFPVHGSNAANWRIALNFFPEEIDMEYDYVKIQPIRMPYDIQKILYQFEIRLLTQDGAEWVLEADEWLMRDMNFRVSLWDSTLRLKNSKIALRQNW